MPVFGRRRADETGKGVEEGGISRMQRSCLRVNRLKTIRDIHLAAGSTPAQDEGAPGACPAPTSNWDAMTKGAARCYPAGAQEISG